MQRNSGQVVIGLIIVAVGLVLLLDNLGVGGSPWRYFPSVITLIGLWTLVRTGFRQPVAPLLLIGFGVALQLSVLNQVPAEVRSAIWPVLIILVGVLFILRRSSRGPAASDGPASYVSIFNGVQDRVSGPVTRLQVTSIFGGVELDLREARVDNPPAVIDVSCLFGGVDIRLAQDVALQNDVLALFGGVEDQRRSVGGDEVTFTLRGAAMFGGLRLKD